MALWFYHEEEDSLIIELKSVEQIKGIYEAQLLTYMKLAGIDE